MCPRYIWLLFILSSSSSARFPEGRDLKEISHLGLSVPRSLALYNVSACLCMGFYLMEEEASLMMAEQGYERSRMSLGIILWLCSVNRSDIWFSQRSLVYLVSGFGYQNSVRPEFYLMKWSVHAIRYCLVTSASFLPQLHQNIRQAGNHTSLKILCVGWCFLFSFVSVQITFQYDKH